MDVSFFHDPSLVMITKRLTFQLLLNHVSLLEDQWAGDKYYFDESHFLKYLKPIKTISLIYHIFLYCQHVYVKKLII